MSFAEHISHVLSSVSQMFYLLKLGMCGELKFGSDLKNRTIQKFSHAMTAVLVIMFYDVYIIKHNYNNSSHSMH